MSSRRAWLRIKVFTLLSLTVVAISLTHCDAKRSMPLFKGTKQERNLISIKQPKKLKSSKRFQINPSIIAYSLSSPFSLPPYDSLSPAPLPDQIAPPYCQYPSNTPHSPTTSYPAPAGIGSTPSSPPPPYYYLSPVLPTQSPPPSPTGIIPGPPSTVPNPPTETFPSPPGGVTGPPGPVMSPPTYVPGPPGPTLTPPIFEPTPPYNTPSPTGFMPSPPLFEPPVVFPPPSVPPPPYTAPARALWCVAKPSVPDPIIEEAMDYACGSGADCDSIQPNGSCYEPNTLFAHASYAFNSYWQGTKVAGGTCEFGGTAMLVTVDPSYDGCHFVYN